MAAFQNLGFEAAGVSPGLAEGWIVDQVHTAELLADYGPGVPGKAIETLEEGWFPGIQILIEVFQGKLIDLFPSIYNVTNDDVESFEREWQSNGFFIATLDGPIAASYDAGSPEDFEDFEEEWDANESNIAVFVGIGSDLTAALYDAVGPAQAFEDFEEEWSGFPSAQLQPVLYSFAATVSFVDSNPDTITRVVGSFIADGVIAGERIQIAGSTFNNAEFLVAAVTALEITLDPAAAVTTEGPVAVTIENFILQVTDNPEDFEGTWANMTTFP